MNNAQICKYISELRKDPVLAAKTIFGIDLHWHQTITLNSMWNYQDTLNLVWRGGSKCVHGDTYIHTNLGLLKIKDAIESDKFRRVGNDGTTSHTSAITGTYVKVNNTDAIKVTFESGNHVICSPAHPLKVYRNDVLKFVSATDLKVGDFCDIVPRKVSRINISGFSKKLVKIFSYILYYSDFIDNRYYLKSSDIEFVEFMRKKLSDDKKFDFEWDNEKQRFFITRVGSSDFRTIIDLTFGINCQLTIDKICMFDGSIDAFKLAVMKHPEMCSYDHFMYLRNDNSFCGGRVPTFKDGFSFMRKRDFMESIGVKYSSCYGSLTDPAYYEKYKELTVVDAIKSIENVAGEVDYYDVECVGHEFVSNGVISHNTFISAVDAILLAMLYPNVKIGAFTFTYSQIKKFYWSNIEMLVEMSDLVKNSIVKKGGRHITKGNSESRVVFKNGSEIFSFPVRSNDESFRGGRAHAIFLDEFAQMPSDMVSKIRPMLNLVHPDIKTQIHRCTTASELPDYVTEYHKMCKNICTDPKRYHLVELDIESSPIKKDGTWLEGVVGTTNWDEAKSYIENEPQYVVNTEYYNKISFGDSYFIKKDRLDRVTPSGDNECFPHIPGIEILLSKEATERYSVRSKDGYYVIGIDPARQEKADNYAITVLYVKGKSVSIVNVISFNGMPLPDVTRRTAEIITSYNPKIVVVDSRGFGDAISDVLLSGVNTSKGVLCIEEMVDCDLLRVYPTSKLNLQMADKVSLLISNSSLCIPKRRVKTEFGDMVDDVYTEINHLVDEILHIQKRETGHGIKFESKKRKDRWSSLNMAVHGYFRVVDYDQFGANLNIDDKNIVFGFV